MQNLHNYARDASRWSLTHVSKAGILRDVRLADSRDHAGRPLEGLGRFEQLEFRRDVPVPRPEQGDVLVRIGEDTRFGVMVGGPLDYRPSELRMAFGCSRDCLLPRNTLALAL
jgi:hypothetical protein